MSLGFGGKLPYGVLSQALGAIALPAKLPLPEICKSETMPRLAQLTIKQKSQFLGETTLWKGDFQMSSFFPQK